METPIGIVMILGFAAGTVTKIVYDFFYRRRAHTTSFMSWKQQLLVASLLGAISALGINLASAIIKTLAFSSPTYARQIGLADVVIDSVVFGVICSTVYFFVNWRFERRARTVSQRLKIVCYYEHIGQTSSADHYHIVWNGSRADFLFRWPHGNHPYYDGLADQTRIYYRFYGYELVSGKVTMYEVNAPSEVNTMDYEQYIVSTIDDEVVIPSHLEGYV